MILSSKKVPWLLHKQVIKCDFCGVGHENGESSPKEDEKVILMGSQQ